MSALNRPSRMSIIAVLILFALVGATAEEVVIPNFRGRTEEEVFAYAVLNEALRRADPPYTIVKSERAEMTNARALAELESGAVDILWVGTSRELESRFQAIYIPITRGLLGHRLFVIHKERQPLFDRVEGIHDLRELMGGQGTGWTDTFILREANLRIATAGFDDLFRLVDAGRIDYYPLGASEVYPFVSEYRNEYPNIAVEEEIVLVYRFDFLFFLNRENQELYRDVRTGLLEMYEDGTYMKMYRSHPEITAYLDRADIDSRRRIEIENPIASESLLAIPDRFWMSPGE